MNISFKRFILKMLLFLLFIFLGQAIIVQPNSENTSFPEKDLLDKYFDQKTEIIYFGDSSVYYSWEEDNDKRSIPDRLRELINNHSVGEIYYPAFSTEIYQAFCEYIIKKGMHPLMIIIPINLRSFSAGWDLKPDYQFKKEKYFLKHGNPISTIFYQPLTIFRFFQPDISSAQYDQTLVYDGDRAVGTIKEYDYPNYYTAWSEKCLKNIMVFQYMNSIPENHRKIKAMMATARILKENHIKVLFYITPIDYQTGVKYLGNHFMDRVSANETSIKSLLVKEGIEPLDLLFALPTEDFYWDQGKIPCEHLYPMGKQYVAQQLANRMKGDLPP